MSPDSGSTSTHLCDFGQVTQPLRPTGFLKIPNTLQGTRISAALMLSPFLYIGQNQPKEPPQGGLGSLSQEPCCPAVVSVLELNKNT